MNRPHSVKRTAFLPALLLSSCLATSALADEKAVQKYRNFTPEQVKNLPEKVLKSELPLMYNFAARRGLMPGSELFFGGELNSLMYPGIHDYKAAVKAFQADLGDVPTGTLTVWQIHKLEQRAGMQKLSSILFPDLYSSFKDESNASIQGTLTIIDEKIAFPINHVKVKCYRQESYCELNQLEVKVPDDNSWTQNYGLMESNSEYFQITHWDKDSIDAIASNTGTGCRTTSFNLNFKTKEFYYITRNAGGTCKMPSGASLDKLTKPRIAQIVDGKKIIEEEFAKVTQAAYNVLASDFRKKVDKLVAAEEAKNK